MKKLILLFTFLSGGTIQFSFCQSGGIARPPSFNPSARVSLQASSSNYYPVTFTDNTGRTISRGEVKDAEGSPYFKDNWQCAEILISSNQIVSANKIKIHLQANEIHYLNDNNQIIIVNDGVIKSFTFTDSLFSVKNEKFSCGFPAIDNQNEKTFYEVLSEGRYTLLKYIRKDYVENKNQLSGEITKEFVESESLYTYVNNHISELKKQKSQVLGVFKTDFSILNKYIDDNKISFKKAEDLKKLFDFANTLRP